MIYYKCFNNKYNKYIYIYVIIIYSYHNINICAILYK